MGGNETGLSLNGKFRKNFVGEIGGGLRNGVKESRNFRAEWKFVFSGDQSRPQIKSSKVKPL